MLNYIFSCFANFCFPAFFSSYVFSSSPFSSSSCSTFYDIFEILSPDLLNFAKIGFDSLFIFKADFFCSGAFRTYIFMFSCFILKLLASYLIF